MFVYYYLIYLQTCFVGCACCCLHYAPFRFCFMCMEAEEIAWSSCPRVRRHVVFHMVGRLLTKGQWSVVSVRFCCFCALFLSCNFKIYFSPSSFYFPPDYFFFFFFQFYPLIKINHNFIFYLSPYSFDFYSLMFFCLHVFICFKFQVCPPIEIHHIFYFYFDSYLLIAFSFKFNIFFSVSKF